MSYEHEVLAKMAGFSLADALLTVKGVCGIFRHFITLKNRKA